jgi:hypothetical protein
MNWRPKALGVVTATAALLCMSATGAAADRPLKEHFDDDPIEISNTSLCGFEIQIGIKFSAVETLFLDKAGDVVRAHVHGIEQDTFSANGVTLVGERYRFLIKTEFVDGELVEAHGSGMFEKVRLPDGKIFMAAGRLDFLATTVDFIIDPDSGVLKNQDAFCDALSG